MAAAVALFPRPAAVQEAKLSRSEIHQCVRDLESNDFRTRELATRKLVKAGTRALDALAAASTGDSLEAALRTFRILKEMCREGDVTTVHATERVLARLARGGHPAAAQRARLLLDELQQGMFVEMRALGGSVRLDRNRSSAVWLDSAQDLKKALRLLRRFPEVTYLSLANPLMNDLLVPDLKDLSKLEHLNLFQAPIGDNGLRQLATLSNLRHLSIGRTRVTDAGLIHLHKLKDLEYLELRGDNITDAGLAHLRGLSKLTGLHLGETKVTDAGLVHLRGLIKLSWLQLDHTRVTEAGIKGLRGALPKLRISTE